MRIVAGIFLAAVGLAVSFPVFAEAADSLHNKAVTGDAGRKVKSAAHWYSVPSCDHVAAEALRPDHILLIEDEFEKVYPRELVGLKDDSPIVLDLANLRQIVMYAACASDSAGGEFIPENTLALFDSKRYGKQAYRVLKEEEKTGGEYSRQAKEFYRQMKEFAR